MKNICVIIIASLFTSLSYSEPLLTASCSEPMGSSMEYGVSSFERVEAEVDKKSLPKPHFKTNKKDGFPRKPTFIIDSNKKKATIIWAESAADEKLIKQRKSLNLPPCNSCSPPPAVDVEIVMFTPDQITAIEVNYGAVDLYSLFPKLGTAFISEQHTEPSGKNSTQISTFAECEFVWSELQR